MNIFNKYLHLSIADAPLNYSDQKVIFTISKLNSSSEMGQDHSCQILKNLKEKYLICVCCLHILHVLYDSLARSCDFWFWNLGKCTHATSNYTTGMFVS